MFFISLLGLFLRLTFINKAEGLWNDEYVSWMVSSTPFGQGFFTEILKQCHMPLYYLYLKPFTGFSDLILRLTSLVPSVISIFVMYKVGKEFSKKTGLMSALATSALSFLIYYSQEVRFYSLLFLFSALLLLFTIRLIKENSKYNLAGFIISSLLVIFTHILGVIFVFFNILYVLYKNNSLSKKMIIYIALTGILVFPFAINVLSQLPSSQWWGKFSYTNILFLFTDYLSPILTNNINVPPVFFYNPDLTFWLIVPTLLGVIGIFYGIKNNKGITTVAILYTLTLMLLAVCGKLVFITKYSIEILPIIIILLSVGFDRMKKNGIVLYSLFILIHLSSFFTPYYATKLYRSEGNRIVGEILNHRNAQNIIYTYYAPDRFSRYYKGSAKQLYISKINRFEYKNNPNAIFSDINKGETVSVVFLDSVSFLPEDYIKKYNSAIPEMFSTFSHIRNMLTEELKKNYKIQSIDKSGSWTVITAKK